MSTKLEQIQAAAKAKQAAGQPIFSQQVSTPTVAVQTPTPAVGVSSAPKAATPAVSTPAVSTPVQNTASSVKNASSLSPQIAAEVQRKASAGIALTNPTAATQSAYNAAVKPAVTAPKATAPAASAAPTAAVSQPNTNYVQQGGKTLNDLLYLKKSYESGKTGAAAYAGQYYNQLDPNTAAAVKDMNAAQLEQYIMGLGSGNATAAQVVPQEAMQATPAVAAKDYNALAQAQYDRELAAMLAGAQSQETELNRRYEYANGVTQDNRQLETATFNRNNAPTAWDGSTGYQAAQMDRNRSIEDHYTKEGLTDAVAAAYAQSNAFRDQSGNFISTKANELQTAAQQLAMQEAGLTGIYKGQQTMQGASNAASTAGQLLSNQSQQIANQIAQINLDNYPTQVKLELQQLQQQVESGKISNAQAQYQLTELTNPESTTNQVKALELKMKQIDASNYSESQKLQLEQLRKTVAEIGKVVPVSDTEARLNQLKVLTAEAELQKLQESSSTTKSTAKTYEDYQSNIEKIARRDEDTGDLLNPERVEEYILNSDMSEYEMYRAYRANGLKWGGAIPTKGEQ